MEPLHNYHEYAKAVETLNQWLDKLQLEGLSDNETMEFKELEKRVVHYRFIAAKTVGDVLPKKSFSDTEKHPIRISTGDVVCDSCGSVDFYYYPGIDTEVHCNNCGNSLTKKKKPIIL